MDYVVVCFCERILGMVNFNALNPQDAQWQAKGYAKYWLGMIELLRRDADGQWQMIKSWKQE